MKFQILLYRNINWGLLDFGAQRSLSGAVVALIFSCMKIRAQSFIYKVLTIQKSIDIIFVYSSRGGANKSVIVYIFYVFSLIYFQQN